MLEQNFLLRDSYQGNILYKSITIGWMWSGMSSHVQTCLNVSRGELGWSRGDKVTLRIVTTQKMKFSIKEFFSKCDQIRRKLRIWSHLLKKSLMENFIFCAVSSE